MKRFLQCFLFLYCVVITGFSGTYKTEDFASQLSTCLTKCKQNIDNGNLENIRVLTARAKIIYSQAHTLNNNQVFNYLSQMAGCHVFLGENQQAQAFYTLAEKKINNKSDPINSLDVAEFYFNRGGQFASENNFSKAVYYYLQAIGALKQAGKHPKKTEILYKASLALAYWNNCDIAKASAIADSCQSFLNHVKQPLDPGLLDIYLTLTAYSFYGERDYALINRNIHLASQIMKAHFPVNHYKYGILLYYKGLYYHGNISARKAIHYFDLAREIIAKYPSYEQYEYFIDRAKALSLVAEKDTHTVLFCNQAIHRTRLAQKYPEIFYQIMGRAYHAAKDTANAIQYYNKTISAAALHHNSYSVSVAAMSYFHLSDLFYFKNANRSLNYLFKGLSVARTVFLRNRDISMFTLRISRIYYNKLDYKRSLYFLQQTLIASSVDFSDTSILKNPANSDLKRYMDIETLLLKANALFKIYLMTPNPDYLKAALSCNELGIQMLEKMIADTDDDDLGMRIIEQAKRTMNNAVYFSMYLDSLTGDHAYAEKALMYAEKSKMQILFIKMAKIEIFKKAGVPDSIIRKDERIQNNILELENQLVLQKAEIYDFQNKAIQRKLTRLYDDQNELLFYVNDHYPLFKKLRYDLRVAGIKQIREILDPDQAIVEYEFLMHQNIIFVITHDTFSIQFKLCDKEIRRQIEKLRSSITTSPVEGDFTEQFNKFTSSSKYLYDELITPVYDQIKGKRLIIIPHNELTLIPFEALISNIPKDRDFRNLPYLIKEFPVVYAYSANFLLDQGKNKKYGKGTAVFLPDYDTWENSKGINAFNSLQGAKNEAKRIRKITGGRIFSGSKATEAMFKRKAPLYRIIHIASHALLNEENPNLSSLVFNKSADSINEGYLYSFELRQMKLNAQLVVLSGCNTGYGKLRISEGLVSLSRSLFYTNVRTVAFTLWSVADNSGSILVTNFYKGLYKKQLLDIAMRNAKLDFLKNTDPVRTHPYYWANFMVVGKTENIPVHPPFNRIWFVLLSLIGATTAVFLFRKFRA